MVLNVRSPTFDDTFKFANMLPVIKVKPGDTTKNNDTTLADDPDLFFNVQANSVYLLQAFLFLEIRAASDFKYTFTVPAAATAVGIGASVVNSFQWGSGAMGVISNVDLTATRVPTVTSDFADASFFPSQALFTIGANAGVVHLQWAQNAAVAENTSLKKGSTLLVYKIL